jgi:hypothetical protein
MEEKMRRYEREITDKNIIDTFIAEEQILRVAFYDNGNIYIVPVNYGYSNINDSLSFYFHGAKAGRKYELSKCDPIVGFEIDGKYRLIEGKTACDFSAAFQSIIGTGTLHVVTDKAEKITGLNSIMKQTTHNHEWNYNDKMIEAVAVYRLDVDKLTCKLH